MAARVRGGMSVPLWFSTVLAAGWLLCVPTRVLAAQELRAGIEDLATQIITAVPEGGPLRIAVADFLDLQNAPSNLGRYVANRLTTRLAQNPKFSVIERQRLEQVLNELKFGTSDLVDPTKAKQLGRMVGVEALVVGTVSDLGRQVDIDARVIELDTGRMLRSATVTISKDQMVAQLLGQSPEIPPTGSSSEPPPSARPSPRPPAPPRVIQVQEFPQFRVEVERVQATSDGTVLVFVAYVNTTQEPLVLGLCWERGAATTFVLDAGGARYLYQQSSGIGDVCSLYGEKKALSVGPGGRAAAVFTFRRVSGPEDTAKSFSFISEHVIVQSDTERRYRVLSRQSIALRDIVAQ